MKGSGMEENTAKLFPTLDIKMNRDKRINPRFFELIPDFELTNASLKKLEKRLNAALKILAENGDSL